MQNAQNKAEILKAGNSQGEMRHQQKEIQHKTESALSSLRFKVLIGATALATSFSLGDNLKAQTAEKKLNDPKGAVEVATNTPLAFTLNNVDKYFPDMKQHLNELIKNISTPEWKNAVNQILQQTVRKAADEKQRVGGAIYAIETFVLYGKDFGDKYDAQITDETVTLLMQFNKEYDVWFGNYVAGLKNKLLELDETLKKQDEDIAKNIASIEATMLGFSPEQIRKSQRLKELVLQTEAAYIKFKQPLSGHLKLLIQATK